LEGIHTVWYKKRVQNNRYNWYGCAFRVSLELYFHGKIHNKETKT